MKNDRPVSLNLRRLIYVSTVANGRFGFKGELGFPARSVRFGLLFEADHKKPSKCLMADADLTSSYGSKRPRLCENSQAKNKTGTRVSRKIVRPT
jgi:hypothetical protein